MGSCCQLVSGPHREQAEGVPTKVGGTEQAHRLSQGRVTTGEPRSKH